MSSRSKSSNGTSAWMSAYGRRSSKTRRRKSPNHCFWNAAAACVDWSCLSATGDLPRSGRVAEQGSDPFAVGSRGTDGRIAGEHGVRSRASCQEITNARIVPAEARVVLRLRENDGLGGAQQVVELVHQGFDRETRVDRLATVVICERRERVVRDLDVGARAAAAERTQLRDDDGILGFDRCMHGSRIDGHAGHDHTPACERHSSGQRIYGGIRERGITLGLELPKRAKQRQRVGTGDAWWIV